MACSPNIQTFTYALLIMNTNLGYPINIDFLDKLKKQSAIAHKTLENLVISTSILSPNMAISDYCHYLSLMYECIKTQKKTFIP